MSNLLEELGVDPDDFRWDDLALCKEYPIGSVEEDIFYDLYESDVESAKAADEICLSCPVIRQCFFAGADGEIGLWGGVYWNGSGQPDKNKNAHKTDETWAKIYERVGR